MSLPRPTSRFSKIEIILNEDKIEVWFRARLVFTLAVVTTDHPRLIQVLRNIEDFAVHQDVGLDAHKLDIIITSAERDMVGLVKHRTIAERFAHRKEDDHGSSSDIDTIDSRSRDSVLIDLLDSLLDNPQQSHRERRDESIRIAKKHDVGLYRVAGVRANLTRGSYGEIKTLLERRRRDRIRKAQQ